MADSVPLEAVDDEITNDFVGNFDGLAIGLCSGTRFSNVI